MKQPPDPACVAILLSTYNGARFLPEQLASYLTQSHTAWRLYWRDDASADRSAAMVRAFADGPGRGRCEQVADVPGWLGPARSFHTLARAALAGPAAYFAFSDQDDVWLPEKLAEGVAALAALGDGRPALYFCPRQLVDATLRPLGPVSRPRRPPGFPGALTQNVIPGCSMILNRAAARLVAENPLPAGTMHDWWSYLTVTAVGGPIVAGTKAGVLHRQHDGNTIGEPRGPLRRAVGACRRGRVRFIGQIWRHTAALRLLPAALPEATRAVLTAVDESREGGALARLRVLRLPGFSRQTWLENALFGLWFVMGDAPARMPLRVLTAGAVRPRVPGGPAIAGSPASDARS